MFGAQTITQWFFMNRMSLSPRTNLSGSTAESTDREQNGEPHFSTMSGRINIGGAAGFQDSAPALLAKSATVASIAGRLNAAAGAYM